MGRKRKPKLKPRTASNKRRRKRRLPEPRLESKTRPEELPRRRLATEKLRPTVPILPRSTAETTKSLKETAERGKSTPRFTRSVLLFVTRDVARATSRNLQAKTCSKEKGTKARTSMQ